MRSFDSLTEREVLALAISLEEEDERVYADFAEGLRTDFCRDGRDLRRHAGRGIRAPAAIDGSLSRKVRGSHSPDSPPGCARLRHPQADLADSTAAARCGAQIGQRDGSGETRHFYETASARSQDVHIRKLLDDLALEERSHEEKAEELKEEKLGRSVEESEDLANRRLFVLQIVQPGLAGLMDGSVSTLAPVFAAAFATQQPEQDAFVVGLAASIGARASAWGSLKPCRTMAASLSAATPGRADSFAD